MGMSAGTSIGERAVGRQRHRAQFHRLVAGVDDVRMRRAGGQRQGPQHADRPDLLPVGLGLAREPHVLAVEKAGGLGRADALAVHLVGDDRRARPRRRGRPANGPSRPATRRPTPRWLSRGSITAMTSEFIRRAPGRRTVASSRPSGSGARSPRPPGSGWNDASRAAGRGDEVAAAGDAGQLAVGQRRRAAVAERPQAHAVVGPHVGPDLGLAVGAVGPDDVDLRLHLGAVEEVVGADEGDPAVGHHLRLVVEDRREGDRLDARCRRAS